MKSNDIADRLLLKGCVVGSAAVGKTSFFRRYREASSTGYYSWAVYDPTRFETSSGEQEVCIELNDVRSTWQYPQFRSHIFRNTDVLMIFYSVTDRRSYHDVEKVWLLDAHNHCQGVPVVLVATKTDIREEAADCVSEAEGEELAKRISAQVFVEVSLLCGEGLDDLMSEVVICAAEHKLRKRSEFQRASEPCFVCKIL